MDQYQYFLDRAKMIDYAGSWVSLDALRKLPGQTDSTARLMEFMAVQELVSSGRSCSADPGGSG